MGDKAAGPSRRELLQVQGSAGGGRMAEVTLSLLIQGQQNGSPEEIKWCAESHKKPLRQSQA